MAGQGVEQLLQRVARLERESRLWRRVGAVASLAALTLAVGGAAGRQDDGLKEVRVGRIVVQAKEGDSKAIVLSAEGDAPSLTFLHDNQPRISVGVAPDGASMITVMDGGRPRMMFGLSRNGAPVINLLDENQRRRVMLGIYPKGGPMISVLDEQNKAVFKAP